MTRISAVYEGGLHTRVLHGPTGAEIATDAPPDNQGKGEAFSPTDLVAAAMGSCMLTLMGITAARRDLDLEGARVEVVKHMVNDPHRRIGRLEVTFDLPSCLAQEHRTVLERAALTCPVHRSLHPEVEIPVTFRYGE